MNKSLYFAVLFCITLCIVFVKDGFSSIIIDDLNQGSFSIASDGPGTQMVEHIQDLPSSSTIGGKRKTWAQKGYDNDIAAATLQDGAMTFTLDNDDCRTGLSYSGFDEINLADQAGIAFELLGLDSVDSGSTVNVNLKLTDGHGNSQSSDSLGMDAFLSIDNLNTQFGFMEPGLWSGVDLGYIAGIDICFSGGNKWFNPQITSIATFSNGVAPIPEPSTSMLLLTGLVAFIWKGSGGKRERT